MTRFSVAILPEAEAEIRGAFLWYAERSALASEAFRAEVFDAIDGLAHTADIWPAEDDNVRRYVLRRFPFIVHYELDGNDATVLAVAHQRRRPGYWRDRR